MKGRPIARESLISSTFVQLADTLVADFDIIDLLTMLVDRCVELIGADAAGILLTDARGNLRVMAASSEQVRLLELFQLQNEQGPCIEAFTSGKPVLCEELRRNVERWPRFAPYAIDAGFASVYALPLRLRDSVIGALNLFKAQTGPIADADIQLAQAFADVASVAILQDQAARKSRIRDLQLANALYSRVVIEQAKGMLSEGGQIDMGAAFDLLRGYARTNNVQLTRVAEEVVAGTLAFSTLSGDATRP